MQILGQSNWEENEERKKNGEKALHQKYYYLCWASLLKGNAFHFIVTINILGVCVCVALSLGTIIVCLCVDHIISANIRRLFDVKHASLSILITSVFFPLFCFIV